MHVLHSPRVEVAQARWLLAQELGVSVYPEFEEDAKLLLWALGRLPG